MTPETRSVKIEECRCPLPVRPRHLTVPCGRPASPKSRARHPVPCTGMRPSPGLRRGRRRATLRALRGNRSTSPSRASVEVMAGHHAIAIARGPLFSGPERFRPSPKQKRALALGEKESEATADSARLKDAPPLSGLRAARGRPRRSLIRASLRRGRRSWRGRGTADCRSPLGRLRARD
jgi:hypothetical protein